jgi:hypothetical protein
VCSELKFDDGREHIAKWTQLFAGDASIGQEQFNARLSTLEFDMPAGPPEPLAVVQAIPSQVRLLRSPHTAEFPFLHAFSRVSDILAADPT